MFSLLWLIKHIKHTFGVNSIVAVAIKPWCILSFETTDDDMWLCGGAAFLIPIRDSPFSPLEHKNI